MILIVVTLTVELTTQLSTQQFTITESHSLIRGLIPSDKTSQKNWNVWFSRVHGLQQRKGTWYTKLFRLIAHQATYQSAKPIKSTSNSFRLLNSSFSKFPASGLWRQRERSETLTTNRRYAQTWQWWPRAEAMHWKQSLGDTSPTSCDCISNCNCCISQMQLNFHEYGHKGSKATLLRVNSYKLRAITAWNIHFYN
jgi:hypothetical protein